MFDIDKWTEILATMQKNWLRTILTAFSVSWGIFMLVLLLGAGNGLQQGVEFQFKDDAVNSLWIRTGQTSIAYKGLQPGRDIQFTNADYDKIKASFPEIEHITSRYYLWGGQMLRYKNNTGSFDIRSTHSDHKYLEMTVMVKGRFLNEFDIAEKRKVTVIGVPVAKELFEEEPPLGKYIEINGIPFKVVGIFRDDGGENEERKVYIPISTAQQTFGGYNKVHQIMLTVGDATVEETQKLETKIHSLLADRHLFDPEDKRAVSISNNLESFRNIQRVFDGIALFIWVIGIGTLIAGIVGVSNIMLIIVKERTVEIGIRKAIGATPWSVISLILQESILITTVAGYMGLVAGVGLLELINKHMPLGEFFINPSVDIKVAFAALMLLVISGTIAGFFPARKAAAIKPIEALRDE